jgi:lysosomal acid lipase/cholesteryl ester hydrolase
VQELAKYDVPANLKFIKAKTGHEKIIYVGHSQGTTQYFMAHTLHPELHKSYLGFVGIAPILFTGNLHSALIDTFDKF